MVGNSKYHVMVFQLVMRKTVENNHQITQWGTEAIMDNLKTQILSM